MTDRRYWDGTVIEAGRPLGQQRKGGKWVAFLNFMQDGDSFLMDKIWVDNHGYPCKTDAQLKKSIKNLIQVIRNASKNPKCSNEIVTRRIQGGYSDKFIGYRLWAVSKHGSRIGKKDERIIACSLCGKDIEPKGDWYYGNNAEPLSRGRACDDCNASRVIPARLADLPKWDIANRFKQER